MGEGEILLLGKSLIRNKRNKQTFLKMSQRMKNSD